MDYRLNFIKEINGDNNPRGFYPVENNIWGKPLQEEPKMNIPEKYVYTDHYLTINSGSRTDNYPRHYDYRINLNKEYKNVVKASLVAAVLPNNTGILDEPYLSLSIDELNFIDTESSGGYHTIFAIMPIKTPVKTTGGFIIPEMTSSCNTELVFKTGLARLSTLTVKIKDNTGALYTFGNGAGSTLKELQHTFTLKLTTRDSDRMVLQNNSVF
jgi:hypothetical protein